MKKKIDKKAPIHNIRFDDDDWDRLRKIAQVQGYNNITGFVKHNLRMICRKQEEQL